MLRNTEIAMNDVLYIGVRCINPCQYTIASNYFAPITLTDSKTSQIRLDAYSSNLFTYYVPTDAADGFATAVSFTIVSEDDYNPIDLYFSIDNNIFIAEERKIENVVNNGVGFYITSSDYGWCTRCNIYFFANIKNDGRYYITASASSGNPTITAMT